MPEANTKVVIVETYDMISNSFKMEGSICFEGTSKHEPYSAREQNVKPTQAQHANLTIKPKPGDAFKSIAVYLIPRHLQLNKEFIENYISLEPNALALRGNPLDNMSTTDIFSENDFTSGLYIKTSDLPRVKSYFSGRGQRDFGYGDYVCTEDKVKYIADRPIACLNVNNIEIRDEISASSAEDR